MSAPNAARRLSVAVGRRFDSLYLLDGQVKVGELDIEYPEAPRTATGAPMPMFSLLAREHPWDVGEMAFSTYLMCRDLGKPYVALPIFPSRFFPHTGAWANRQTGLKAAADLIGKRVACGSFATNYSVWWRGALTHQYDLPIQKITWVESVEEHLPEYHPPKRFQVERMPGETDPAVVLSEGKTDAASLPGPARGVDLERIAPLYEDPYPEIAAYVEANGFIPINTVVTVRTDTVARNSDLPRLLLDAYNRAKALYDAEIAEGKQDLHMGLSLSRLRDVTGLVLPEYGFRANRTAIQTMIAYCYEQGVIRRLVQPEDLFLLIES